MSAHARRDSRCLGAPIENKGVDGCQTMRHANRFNTPCPFKYWDQVISHYNMFPISNNSRPGGQEATGRYKEKRHCGQDANPSKEALQVDYLKVGLEHHQLSKRTLEIEKRLNHLDRTSERVKADLKDTADQVQRFQQLLVNARANRKEDDAIIERVKDGWQEWHDKAVARMNQREKKYEELLAKMNESPLAKHHHETGL